jgi:Na+-transporting methylmalonyl-CoA/oxaloacetate decarboxylase beta subunit
MNFIDFLLNSFKNFDWKTRCHDWVGIFLFFLPSRKKLEPSLLLPMGFERF